MLDDTAKMVATIDINDQEYQCTGEIRSLIPFHCHFRIGHKRLGLLDTRVTNTNRCGDATKAKMWQVSRDRMIRVLAGQAALQIGPELVRRRRKLDWALHIAFALSTILYWYPGQRAAAIGIDLILFMALWMVEREFNSRMRFVGQIVASSFGAPGADLTVKVRRRKEAANAKH